MVDYCGWLSGGWCFFVGGSLLRYGMWDAGSGIWDIRLRPRGLRRDVRVAPYGQ